MPPSGFIIKPEEQDRLRDQPVVRVSAVGAAERIPRKRAKQPTSVTQWHPEPSLEAAERFTPQIWTPSGNPPMIGIASPVIGHGSGEGR